MIQEMITTVQAFNSVTSQLIVVDGLPAIEGFIILRMVGCRYGKSKPFFSLRMSQAGRQSSVRQGLALDFLVSIIKSIIGK